MNFTDRIQLQGIHPKTAYRRSWEGAPPVPAARVNPRPALAAPDAVTAPRGGIGLYAQASSQDHRAGLGRQVARRTAWAVPSGCAVARARAEVGPRDERVTLEGPAAARRPGRATVMVEHRDRLGRVNTELVEAALSAHGRGLVVLNPDEVDDDLVRDAAGVLTSLCARLHGRRSARNRAGKALRCAARDASPASPRIVP